jgi:hypothetical protein
MEEILLLAKQFNVGVTPLRKKFTCMCLNYLSFHKFMALNKKKVGFCFNKIVCHPTSVMRCEMPLKSYFLTGELGETDQYHDPIEVQISHHWIFFCEDL